jgi:hypothetical protein
MFTDVSKTYVPISGDQARNIVSRETFAGHAGSQPTPNETVGFAYHGALLVIRAYGSTGGRFQLCNNLLLFNDRSFYLNVVAIANTATASLTTPFDAAEWPTQKILLKLYPDKPKLGLS